MNDSITIPEHELEITSSRSGGPGGQHVNTTNSRITVRWNIPASSALTDEQRARLLEKLQSQLTSDGDLIVHHSSSRSQQQNKEMAIALLGQKIQSALYVPKKRMKSRMPKRAKEAHLHAKAHRGAIKKMRSKKTFDE
jgi:ribosome-associated protein